MSVLLPAFGRPGAWSRWVGLTASLTAFAFLAADLPAASAGGAPGAPTQLEQVPPEAAAAPEAGEPLTAPDAVTAMTIARLEGVPVEVLSERTESTSVFALPDGTMAAAISSGPRQVLVAGDGSNADDWAPIDVTLRMDDDGVIRAGAHVGNPEISGGTPAEAGPEDSVAVASMTGPDGTVSSISWLGPLPEPTLDGARAVYAEVRPGIDMVIEVTATGVEQFFVLHEAPGEGETISLPVELATDGGAAEQLADGAIEMRAEDGSLLAVSPDPTMWDATADADRVHPVTKPWVALDPAVRAIPPMPDWAAERAAERGRGQGRAPAQGPDNGGNRGNGNAGTQGPPDGAGPQRPAMSEQVAVARNVERRGHGSVRMDLAPQPEFLADPDTVYPVVVDPAINIGAYFDTFVQSNSSADLSANSELLMGTWNSGSTKARSFANFGIGVVAGKTVLGANLYLVEHHSWSCQARNWQVWATGLASSGTRWSSQPAWVGHYSTSSQTRGYSSSCPDGDVIANVTSLMQANALGAPGSNFGIGLKAENEADNYAWKRFYSNEAGAGPIIWVNYNTRPNVPTGLRVSHSPTGTVSGAWTSTLTPTLSAVISDPDGGSVNGNFRLRRKDTGAQIWTGAANYLANGAVGSVQVPAGILAEGQQYEFSATSSDNITDSALAPWFTFGVDTGAPFAPTVTSTDFPDDNRWHSEPNQPGTFTITLPSADSTVTGFRWGLDKAADPNQVVAAPAGASGTLQVTPTTAGRHVLYVQSVDRAGNVSGATRYAFNVGRAGILTPDEGAQVVRRVRLTVGAVPEATVMRLQWRRGPDSAVINPVPLAHISTSAGKPWAQEWEPIPGPKSYTTWDAGETLGFSGGPVQVRAQVSASAQGSPVYDTQWVTITVDNEADGAATTGIGPGSVNLLTGDHSLSVTDVEEFGLGVVRTASSRDPDSGYQMQRELLLTGQVEMSALTGATGVTGGNATPSIVTNQYHGGTTSLKIVPAAGNTNGDTYAAIGGDAGGMRLNLQPGRTYRFSAWVYVPSTSPTVPTPHSPRGLRMTLFTRVGTGAYSEPSAPGGAASPRPTVTNAWQQVTFDATIPAGASEVFLRVYNGFTGASGQAVYWDDLSIRELWSPFGPEWSLGTVDASAGTAYTRISKPYPDVAEVHFTGGGSVWFTSGDGVKWWPEPGAEDLTLKATSATTWRLTELDGTYTDFVQNAATKDFPVTTTSPPGAVGATRHVYDWTSLPGVSRLSRIIAPIEPGVDNWPTNAQACTTTDPNAAPARGCEVLEFAYATATTANTTTFGSFAGRVSQASIWSWDPATSAMVKTPVAQYAYDTSGRLRQVHDPRIVAAGSPALTTTYAYDASNRVVSVAPQGEPSYRFTYGSAGPVKTGSGDLIDASTGRLLKVTRSSLVPGTLNDLGPDNTTTVVYGVPLTRQAGGPYDLGPAALASWVQVDGPTDATAVFGPTDPPAVTTATSANPGADGYRTATVHYLNASGREVNTASPAPLNAPVEGYIDTAEYDDFGNVVRTLDATNRLLALKKLPGWEGALAQWGLEGRTSGELSQLLDSRATYGSDGLDVLTQTGPIQQLVVGDDPSDVRTLRPFTTYAYDEGKPDGVAYHLVTTTTSMAIDPATNDTFAAVATVNGYNPVDDAPVLGATSGWVHKQPTTITIDATGSAPLTATMLYDARGRVIQSSKPGSSGSDAATTRALFYTAGANAADAACGNRPEWAGQPCMTIAAGPVTGHDASRMATELSVKRVTAYNKFGSPTVVTESATGPVDGVVVAQTRTSTTTYDAADRITTVSITGTGTGVGAPVSTVRTVYSPTSGEVVGVQALAPNGSVSAEVIKEFDALGRLVSYVDAEGGRTDTTYDRFGKPVTETQTQGSTTIGTRTFTYDAVAEPRGYLTAVTDSVAGTISADWGPDGQLESETLPGGITLSIAYDAARVPIARTYTRDSDSQVIWRDSVVENHRGQWVSHVSTTGTAEYTYDRFGRLTSVNDTLAVLNQCTRRTYAYDAHSNRTGFTSAAGAEAETGTAAECPTEPQTTVSSTYDSADRLQSGFGGAGWVYDPFGRITSMPGADGSTTVTNKFYVNDLVAGQEVAGVARVAWALDPLRRRSVYTESAWVNDAWAESASKVSHYASDSDEPGWIVEDATLPTDVTRFFSGVEGDLAVITTLTGDRVVQLVDLHGDVVGTLPIADGAAQGTWEGLVFSRSDEFGNPVPLTGAGAPNAPPVRYGWLGAAQRSGEALGGVILMGVRLYHPGTGRFLSVDPVPGGSASAYDYCNGDPVNCTDLNGEWPSFKSILSVVATVGEIASLIPGPIGAAAAGVSAIAYAAQGNTGKAIEMGITAAAALVGAGAVVKVAARAVNTARAAGQVARAAPRVARAASTGPSRVRSAVQGAGRVVSRGCSFVPGTLVVLADGTLALIESLQPGDLVLTGDLETGENSAQPVITPLTSAGDKHLIDVVTDAGTWTATAEHPIWVDGKGWTAAADLTVGDQLVGSTGGLLVVRAMHDQGWLSGQTVHNLHVAGTHTYYIASNDGNVDALVHNARDACDIATGSLRKHVPGTNEAITAAAGKGGPRSMFFGERSAIMATRLAVARGVPVGAGRVRWAAGVVVGRAPNGTLLRAVTAQRNARGAWHAWPSR